MKFVTMTAAAALFVIPFGASALTMSGNVAPGNSYKLSDGPFDFNATFENPDGAGAYAFTFENDSSVAASLALAISTINQFSDGDGGFDDYYFTGGVTTTFGDATHQTGAGQLDSFELMQTVAANSAIDLVFDFGNPVAVNSVGPDIDFRVSATPAPVPVPAALPLFASALGLVGYLGRKRRSAA